MKIQTFLLLALTGLLVSCASVEKTPNLRAATLQCGDRVVVWESLPPNDARPFDVSLLAEASLEPCPGMLVVTDAAGRQTTNNVGTGISRFVATNAIKIEMQCGTEPISEIKETCLFVIKDVRRSPVDTNATLNIQEAIWKKDIKCGQSVVAFSTTNTSGCDITLEWQSSTNCNAKISVERADGSTKTFLHDAKTKRKFCTIARVQKLTVGCEGTASGGECRFEIVQRECP